MVNSKIYRYPDLVVIHKDGNPKKFVTNPILITEVLSEGTIDVDREKKRLEYFLISTVQYYLMVHQDEPAIELFIRDGKRWIFDFFTDINDEIELPFFEVKVSLKDIYDGIEFHS